MDVWALRRLAGKLLRLGPAGAGEILQKLGKGDDQGKGRVEIVNPEPS